MNANIRYNLYSTALNIFEKYEDIVDEMKTGKMNNNDLLKCHLDCLQSLQNIMDIEEFSLYFTTLYLIREELENQRQYLQDANEQITINDITISRIDCDMNPETEPFSLAHLFQTPLPRPKRRRQNDHDQESLQTIIEQTLMKPQSHGLCDIAGMASVKQALNEAIIYPMKFPQLFTNERKPLYTILLYGPPGTGKTQLAHSLAAEIRSEFYNISNGDLLSRYVGESEKLIQTLFNYCQNIPKNCIIFIDEIDGLCRKRSSEEHDYARRIKNELLNQLSIMDRVNNNNIYLLAATNCPWDLDEAFLRRFKKRIYVPLPDRKTRLEILKFRSKLNCTVFDEEELNSILDRTDGWSSSDISDLVNCAFYQPLKDLNRAQFWRRTRDDKFMPLAMKEADCIETDINSIPNYQITLRNVNFTDYLTALQEINKTVSNQFVKKYEEFNTAFRT